MLRFTLRFYFILFARSFSSANVTSFYQNVTSWEWKNMPYREPYLFTAQEDHNSYLNFRHSGMDICAPGYCYGPAIRHFYLIHYVIDGKGFYTAGKHTYALGQGDVFLILPNEITSYVADEKDPWSYCFFAFDGEGSEEMLQRTALSRENLTTHLEDDSLVALIEETTQELNRPLPNPDLYSLSQLIRMLKILADQVRVDVDTDKASMRSYVQQVLDFIHFNYAEPITVQEMAGLLSLNRSYLYRIFKEETGLSPIEYLNGYRIDRARQLLVETNIPVGQISVSTGFSTFSSFSRFFRLKYGVSPSTFRKMARTGKAGSVPLLGTD